jgi:hypothetical protein
MLFGKTLILILPPFSFILEYFLYTLNEVRRFSSFILYSKPLCNVLFFILMYFYAPAIFWPSREKLTTIIRTEGVETKYFPRTIDIHQGLNLCPLCLGSRCANWIYLSDNATMHAFFGLYSLGELREDINKKFETWKIALEAHGFCLSVCLVTQWVIATSRLRPLQPQVSWSSNC